MVAVQPPSGGFQRCGDLLGGAKAAGPKNYCNSRVRRSIILNRDYLGKMPRIPYLCALPVSHGRRGKLNSPG